MYVIVQENGNDTWFVDLELGLYSLIDSNNNSCIRTEIDRVCNHIGILQCPIASQMSKSKLVGAIYSNFWFSYGNKSYFCSSQCSEGRVLKGVFYPFLKFYL